LTNIKRIKFFIKGLNSIFNQKLRKKSFQYYSDQYWNDLPQIQNYINQSTTDNPDVTWIEDILTRFKECLPFENVLIVGCGNGWLERQLYDLGIGKSFDAFDISDSHLKLAKKLVENRSINYFKDDINNLKNLKLKNYDAIFNVGVLHHVFRLSKTTWELNKTLKKNGLMFNFEYVGPSYNQYSNEHVKIIKQINNSLPSRFKTIIPVRPKLINFQNGDPSEAVNSDLLLSTISRFFDTVYERKINGGIAYPILWNNTDEFKKIDLDAQKITDFLITKDKEFTREGKIPSLFLYSVVMPKPRSMIPNNEFLSL